jgi:hypothetical protein
VLAAAVAGLATCALAGYVWWSYRGSIPRIDALGAPILVAIGAVSGLVSGRYRDALVSWIAALIGAVAAYWANYTIDPGWPRSDAPFEVGVALAAILLLAGTGGGHLVGVWVADRALDRRRARSRV